MTENKLGAYIEKRRETLGLTRKELGAKTGIQAGTIRKIENGSIKNPPPFRLEMIAKALEIQLSTLRGNS